LNAEIHAELRRLFPDKQIPPPIHFRAYLWTEGGHAWLPNVNSDKVAREVLNPMPNMYVCGEAFSLKQAWIEGALETTTDVKKLILLQSHLGKQTIKLT